jgi:hypothetical protein
MRVLGREVGHQGIPKLRGPSIFSVVTIAEDAVEPELGRWLVAHVRRFPSEFGARFAFLGQQNRVVTGRFKTALPRSRYC